MDRKAEIRSVLNTESFINELDDMTQECFNDIKNSNPEDTEAREMAYNRIKAIESMMTRLQSIIDSDKIKDKSWTIL